MLDVRPPVVPDTMSNKPYATIAFVTGTATLALFDPACLVHRASDDADWWSLPDEELAEVNAGNAGNAGNAMIVGLGSDGAYSCDVYRPRESEAPPTLKSRVVALVRCISGCLYVGAGEQLPAGDFGQETVFGGHLLYCPIGASEITVGIGAADQLIVIIDSSTHEARNDFRSCLKLC